MSEVPGASGEKKKQKTVSPIIEFYQCYVGVLWGCRDFWQKKRRKDDDNLNELVVIRKYKQY